MRKLRSCLLLAALGLACASAVEVRQEPGVDFSSYRGWEWLEGDAFVLHVPEEERDLARRRVARLVEAGLAGRGFAREAQAPDLCVGVILAVRPTVRIVQLTPASQSLSSHHEEAFEIQATESRVERVRHLRLEVYVAECRAGRIVWQGRITRSGSKPRRSELEELVEELLAEFPERRSLVRAPHSGSGLAAAP